MHRSLFSEMSDLLNIIYTMSLLRTRGSQIIISKKEDLRTILQLELSLPIATDHYANVIVKPAEALDTFWPKELLLVKPEK